MVHRHDHCSRNSRSKSRLSPLPMIMQPNREITMLPAGCILPTVAHGLPPKIDLSMISVGEMQAHCPPGLRLGVGLLSSHPITDFTHRRTRTLGLRRLLKFQAAHLDTSLTMRWLHRAFNHSVPSQDPGKLLPVALRYSEIVWNTSLCRSNFVEFSPRDTNAHSKRNPSVGGTWHDLLHRTVRRLRELCPSLLEYQTPLLSRHSRRLTGCPSWSSHSLCLQSKETRTTWASDPRS